jgi:hypothetical protein
MNAKNFIGGKDNGKYGNEICLWVCGCLMAAEVTAALSDSGHICVYISSQRPLQIFKIASAPGQY